MPLLLVGVVSVQAQSLEFTFIGNAAFQISDGATTLLSDYPYRPGAYGYMHYDSEDVQPTGDVLSLVTHQHADHYEAERFEQTDWTLLAPDDVLASVPDTRRLQVSDEVTFKDIQIWPVVTEHADVGHYSYLVEWHGLRLYFTGDTQSTSELLAQEDIDILFVTPWLWGSVAAQRSSLDADEIVIYHQAEGETVECDECLVLEQGASFEREAQ